MDEGIIIFLGGGRLRDIFELNSNDLKWLEDKFKRYYQLDREIAIRKEELKMREPDENIGGGKSNIVSKTIENQVVKEMSDPFIQQREIWKRAVKETIEEQSVGVQEMIVDKFFGENNYMDWVALGDLHNCSQAKTYRIRYKVLETFAKKIGYI